jgi:hypothetical protein
VAARRRSSSASGSAGRYESRSFKLVVPGQLADDVGRGNDRADRRRNASVVAAPCEGNSWASIERRFGVSARQARRIVKDIGTASVTNTTVIDPIGIIAAAVLR